MTERYDLGHVTIQRVVETEALFLPVREFFPAVTDEMLAETRSWMEPRALDPASGWLRFCFQSYVVRTPHHTIDSCIGNDRITETDALCCTAHFPSPSVTRVRRSGSGFYCASVTPSADPDP